MVVYGLQGKVSQMAYKMTDEHTVVNILKLCPPLQLCFE